LDEFVLIERLKQGDDEAFRQIVETWKDMVYNTVIGMLQNQEDAEDVTQEVFIQVFESISDFRSESKFSTWLYRIAVRKSLDHLRKKKRKKRVAYVQSLFGINNEMLIDKPDFNHPGIVLDNKESAAVLFQALEQLPEKQKVAFILNKVEGLSYQEIAEVLKTTLSSVESLLHRAKNNLRKLLQKHYENKG
jgi:RNA polymerase sigma factor (sigma-70 family)